MTEKIKIVVLGGGYAGVEAAKHLHKKLKKDSSVEITLIDKNSFHTLMTELHEVAGGRVAPDSVRVSFEKIFSGTSIKFIADTIEGARFDKKELISKTATYSYDYLILGLGAEPEFFNIEGVQEHSFPLWSYDNAIRIKEHIENCFLQAAREADPERRKALLTFTVAGAGFTGIEMLGELLEWRPLLCDEYNIPEDEVRILLVEAMMEILPNLPKKLREKASKFIEKKGGEMMLSAPITKAESDGFWIKDTKITTDTLIWTCGVKGNSFACELPLTHRDDAPVLSHAIGPNGKEIPPDDLRHIIQRKCRLLTDTYSHSVNKEDVYVIGDVSWFQDKHHVLPQIVETALQTGKLAAENVIARIQGKEQTKLDAKYHGFMVSIGSKYAVANVMNRNFTGFLAMAFKHFVHVHYLLGVAGINAVWAYIKHHFFDIKGNRSFVGGHAARTVKAPWVVFLRVFLGIMWLVEGLSKATGGWLDPDNIYIIPVDDVSAATATVEEVAGTAEAAYNAVEPLLSEPFFLYTWFVDNVVSLAPFAFQAGIVIFEILLGLAFIGGLFTFLAALGSIGLCTMLILGSMAGKEILWYMACAVTMLGGAGRSIGLDYWVIPWIRNWWRSTKFAKKTYLYAGEPRKKRKRK